MIYDHDGQPIEQKTEPHKFGQFKLPDDAHITFRNVRQEHVYNTAILVVGQRDESHGDKKK